jgi:ABC-type dipeptide/oligopeptide/nickel transport system permease component
MIPKVFACASEGLLQEGAGADPRDPMADSQAMSARQTLLRERDFWGYCGLSVLRAVGTLLCATFGAFVALRLVPGDPLTLLAAGRQLDPLIESAWRLRYGFDRPLVMQYLLYIRNLLQGDFGLSYYYSGRPVTELLGSALRTTIQWQIPALVLAIAGALALAVTTCATRKRWMDSAITWLLLTGFSAPEFVVATVLVSTFALRLRVLPVAGVTTPLHFVLPSITMAIPLCAGLCQILRNELVAILQKDYVRTARAKGLSESRILWVHALRNAALPFLAVVAYQVGRCIGGAFLIESIFNIPGVGRLAVSAVLQRDYPVVLAVTTIMTLGFVVNSLLLDLVAGVLDPRIQFAAREAKTL